MEAPQLRLVDERRLADQHPALRCREVLGGVEAEGDGSFHRSVTNVTYRPAPIHRRQRMRGVLEHVQPVRRSDIQDRVEVGRVAGIVDGEQDAWAIATLEGLADGLLEQGRIDVERVGLNIDQYRRRAEVLDHMHRRGERHRRREHRVARTDAPSGKGDVEGGGAGVDRQCSRRTHEIAKLIGELLRARSGRQPAGPQGVDHGLDLVIVDLGWGERQRRRTHPAIVVARTRLG